ncbi:tRNA uracil 4-sulfurtransferase ThiI [Alkalicoccus urumqiensis]|uniref:Probable tRNA sulfurtransferase n=1 Tax=Alkalicoccus urumqiensis TaxID=1548213 RepID=A0A2P6MDA1_ALKUR|nr:tRNA uracil 4-sulfurtransferase ThiI [Alkalicoccus urumqiensis]PRO64243.1 tRNA 4-thiouridine(8) synthase ThiI [Alkalicoccus urumqiensis]
MRTHSILIRYAEMSVKGRNRKRFEKQLDKNIRRALGHLPDVKTTRSYGRMYVHLNGEEEAEALESLKHVFGISSFSPVTRAELDTDDILRVAAETAERRFEEQKGTFKVSVRRVNKSFPTGSQEMNGVIGKAVLQQFPALSVDVHRPDMELSVEIREDGVYVCGETIAGAGGFPVGSSGRALLLLSGGIDSPVAGYSAMKRGVTIEAVHFHSPPYTSERALEKVKSLASSLAAYGPRVRLHIVPFTDAQLKIHQQVPDNCEITVMRRFMLRIAETLASERDIKALVTGDSLGQVASQTLESMYAINAVTTMPVLRPLITQDKLEIMETAGKIGTYETSILPFDDCCTIFVAPDAKTKPKEDKISYYESFLDIDSMVEDAVSRTEAVMLPEKEASAMDDFM